MSHYHFELQNDAYYNISVNTLFTGEYRFYVYVSTFYTYPLLAKFSK